jgi:pyruvate-formate lyase-activating enzyme
MNKNNKNIQFQIDGMFKLKKVGDYLKLVDKNVRLVFKKNDPVLNTIKIFNAVVADLSETGTHLVLRNLHIKKYIFFSKHIEKHSVRIDNILTIKILNE